MRLWVVMDIIIVCYLFMLFFDNFYRKYYVVKRLKEVEVI